MNVKGKDVTRDVRNDYQDVTHDDRDDYPADHPTVLDNNEGVLLID